MKTNVQFAVSILLLLFLVSSCKANQPMKSLKVMSYNIHIATPGSISDFNITDLQAVADVIIREKPDVVVLQEVDKYTVRSNKDSHQAKDLGEMTGMYYHFAGASYKSEGEQGQAILSKYPIKDAKSYKLPLPDESLQELVELVLVLDSQFCAGTVQACPNKLLTTYGYASICGGKRCYRCLAEVGFQ